jgi:hypothetical protein
VGEVQEVQHAEHHGEAEREQRVDATAPEAVDQLLQELGHLAGAGAAAGPT